MKNPHRIKFVSRGQMIGLLLLVSGIVGAAGFWVSEHYGIGALRSELAWCQKTLYDECGDLCNCDPPWYMSNLWMLEMQYETFNSIPVEVCNEYIDESVNAMGTFQEVWDECRETLSDCEIELVNCQWKLEDRPKVEDVAKILEVKN